MPADAQPPKPRLDLARYELIVDGHRVKLERQPMELLILMVQSDGRLVSREDIVERLWGKDVFVDADRSINAAIRKIRSALKDDASHPRYLETVIGKGYRLVGSLEVVGAAVAPPSPSSAERVKPAAAGLLRRLPRVPLLVFMALAIMTAATWRGLEWRGISERSAIRSVAVLPLANLSGDPSQDYFADGMTEELTTDLGKIASLKVVSRTSAQRYRGSNKPLPQIAKELGVGAVIEGSVIRSGNNVRITAQLIDAVHDRHLWAERYERDIGSVLSVQSTVAIEIARQVRIRLTSSEQERLSRHTPVNPEAYDAYLRGRYSQTRQSGDSLKAGVADFQQAIHLDPAYAPAYAGLADSYSLLANYGELNPGEAFPLATAAAKKALQLDPSLPDAYTAAAYPEHHYTWDWAAAERDYRMAISLNPSYPTAHLRYGELLSSVGRHDEAIAEMHRMLDLDPLSLVGMANLGRFLYLARRYDDAIDILNQTLALDPNRAYARLYLAFCYSAKGMFPRALEECLRAFGDRPGAGLAYIYARSGYTAKALQYVNRPRADVGDSDWFYLASIYGALGDKDKAFFCLRNAREKRDFFFVFLKVDPVLDQLRPDARFGQLLRDLGLENTPK